MFKPFFAQGDHDQDPSNDSPTSMDWTPTPPSNFSYSTLCSQTLIGTNPFRGSSSFGRIQRPFGFGSCFGQFGDSVKTCNDPSSWFMGTNLSNSYIPSHRPIFSEGDRSSLEFGIKISMLELLEKSLRNSSQENVVCSPLSMTIVSSMLVLGAKGQTLNQLLDAFKCYNVEELYSRSLRLMQVGKSYGDDDSNAICLANAAFFDQSFRLKPVYEDTITRIYEAQVVPVDFSSKDKAEEKINAGWANRVTNKRMKDLLLPIKLDFLLSKNVLYRPLILANVLYFKGEWRNPFDETQTKKDKFYLLDGTSLNNVPSMQTLCTYEYAKSNDCQFLKIPYGEVESDWRKFSMLIVLPDNNDGLPDLLHKFKSNPKLFCQPANLSTNNNIKLRMPKFKFMYGFKPCKQMKKLGLTLPFEVKNEDLRDLFSDDYPCYVEQIEQKTMIEVNEKGTEFISRTMMFYPMLASPIVSVPKTIEFFIDHPFMFIIKEDVSDTVLCLGAVFNPLN